MKTTGERGQRRRVAPHERASQRPRDNQHQGASHSIRDTHGPRANPPGRRDSDLVLRPEPGGLLLRPPAPPHRRGPTSVPIPGGDGRRRARTPPPGPPSGPGAEREGAGAPSEGRGRSPPRRPVAPGDPGHRRRPGGRAPVHLRAGEGAPRLVLLSLRGPGSGHETAEGQESAL